MTTAPTLPLFRDAPDTEGGHFYQQDGTPAYETLRAKPKKLDDGTLEYYKPTTVREAKKHGLLRSVTTYLQRLASPGLEKWKTDQVLKAAWDAEISACFDPATTDLFAAWAAGVREEASRIGREAREVGTLIHGAIERRIKGEDSDPTYDPHVESALSAITALAPGGWTAEEVVVGDGYAGKVDAIHRGDGIIVDFKTQKTWSKKPLVYDDWCMQGAAYCIASGATRFANVIIDRETGRQCFVKEWTADELTTGWQKFALIRDFVRLESGV